MWGYRFPYPHIHLAKAIIFLGKVDVGVREAVVRKHRSIAEGKSAYFMLTQHGVEDLPKHGDECK